MSLPANFYLPPSAKVHGDPPKYRCLVCDEPFWDMRQFSRHVAECSDRHEEELRASTLRGKNPWMFDDQNEGDVELREYVRRTGKMA